MGNKVFKCSWIIIGKKYKNFSFNKSKILCFYFDSIVVQ